MPTGNKADQFFERLAKLEERVEGLLSYQRWQMGILATILVTVLLKSL